MKKSQDYVLPTTRRPKLEEIIKWFYNAHLELNYGIATRELDGFSKGAVDQQASSGSVSFLMDLMILERTDEKDKYQLTEFGIKFGKLIMKNTSDLSIIWEEAVRKSEFLMDIYHEISTSIYIERKDLIKLIVAKARRDYKKKAARTAATAVMDIMEAAGLIIDSKINNEHRISANAPKLRKPYIAIEKISTFQIFVSDKYDLSKLIALCKEINYCYENEYYYATGMLARALFDHIPPIFNQDNWAGIVNNYAGGSSFKGTMRTLDTFRDVFDKYIHNQISKKENVANEKQIDCTSHLDVLLGEIIRIMNIEKSPS